VDDSLMAEYAALAGGGEETTEQRQKNGPSSSQANTNAPPSSSQSAAGGAKAPSTAGGASSRQGYERASSLVSIDDTLQMEMELVWNSDIMESFDVLNAARDVLQKRLDALPEDDEEREFVEDNLESVKLKALTMEMESQRGILTPEVYLQKVKVRCQDDRKLMRALKAAGRTEDAMAVQKRIDIATAELKEVVDNSGRAERGPVMHADSREFSRQGSATLTAANLQMMEQQQAGGTAGATAEQEAARDKLVTALMQRLDEYKKASDMWIQAGNVGRAKDMLIAAKKIKDQADSLKRPGAAAELAAKVRTSTWLAEREVPPEVKQSVLMGMSEEHRVASLTEIEASLQQQAETLKAHALYALNLDASGKFKEEAVVLNSWRKRCEEWAKFTEKAKKDSLQLPPEVKEVSLIRTMEVTNEEVPEATIRFVLQLTNDEPSEVLPLEPDLARLVAAERDRLSKAGSSPVHASMACCAGGAGASRPSSEEGGVSLPKGSYVEVTLQFPTPVSKSVQLPPSAGDEAFVDFPLSSYESRQLQRYFQRSRVQLEVFKPRTFALIRGYKSLGRVSRNVKLEELMEHSGAVTVQDFAREQPRLKITMLLKRPIVGKEMKAVPIPCVALVEPLPATLRGIRPRTTDPPKEEKEQPAAAAAASSSPPAASPRTEGDGEAAGAAEGGVSGVIGAEEAMACPLDIGLICSYEVLEDLIANKRLAELPQSIQDKLLGQAQMKMEGIAEAIGGGKISMEDYVQRCNAAVERDTQLARLLLKAQRKKEAALVFRRVKVMKEALAGGA